LVINAIGLHYMQDVITKMMFYMCAIWHGCSIIIY